jgi:hypothetical protein
LYAKIDEIRDENLSQNWRGIVKRTIQQHSSDSEFFFEKRRPFLYH